jgi:hypothetical protein
VLGTRVGRLVAEHFADPARLAALGEGRFVRCAAARGLIVRRPVAARLVAAARDALPTRDAAVAQEIVANDLQMLVVLDQQVGQAETQLSALLPLTPFAVLTTVPGWTTVRAGAYGAAIGDPRRWPGARQVYRADLGHVRRGRPRRLGRAGAGLLAGRSERHVPPLSGSSARIDPAAETRSRDDAPHLARKMQILIDLVEP